MEAARLQEQKEDEAELTELKKQRDAVIDRKLKEQDKEEERKYKEQQAAIGDRKAAIEHVLKTRGLRYNTTDNVFEDMHGTRFTPDNVAQMATAYMTGMGNLNTQANNNLSASVPSATN